MDLILHHSVTLRCDADRAFEMFTGNEELQSWLTAVADVEPEVGGKYELFWNPDDRENDSTLGCKVTAIEPGVFLSFEWKGPTQFKHFMNDADPLTHVVVFLVPSTEGSQAPSTRVHVVHSGWRRSPEWDEARLWFEDAWGVSLARLRELVHGPQG